MKKLKKVLALMLALVMCTGLFAGCVTDGDDEILDGTAASLCIPNVDADIARKTNAERYPMECSKTYLIVNRESNPKTRELFQKWNEITGVNARAQTELIAYVNENLMESELCLLSVADHMNMSIYAVSRLFKEGTGVGFKEYITSKRMETAYKLLKTTKDSVADIARTVGIENAKHFSTIFKKFYGISATQVRSGEQVQ